MREPSGSSARWAAFAATTVLVQAITFVLRPTAIYRALELDVPAQWLGALGASFALVPLLLAVGVGTLADRVGERRVMLTGAVVMLLAAVTFTALATSVMGLFVGTVLLGVGHLCSVVGQQALVANRTARDRYDSAFGRYTFAASLGQAVGPGLMVAFGGSAAIPDTDSIFIAAVALAMLLLLVSVFVSGTRASTARADATSGSVRELVRRPGLIRALSVSSMVLAAVDISLVYLPLLGTERGIASGTIGVLLAVRAVASMVSRLFLGQLSRQLGRQRLLTGSVALSALSLAALPIPMPTLVLLVVVTVAGLGLGAGQPLTMSWLAEATPPGLRARAMSLRLTGNRLGQVVVPSTAGLLAVGTGASGVLLVTAGLLATASVASRGIDASPRP